MKSAERVTEIVSLLRPVRSRRLPESLRGAATDGDIDRMQLFVDRGVDIEQTSPGQPTPLGAACAHGRADAVRWLIARGAKIDSQEAATSPVTLALSKAHCEIAALLFDAGLPIDRAAWGAVAAASLGRLDVLRWLVARGLDLDRSYPGHGVPRGRALRSVRPGVGDEVARFLRGELGAEPVSPQPPSARPPMERNRAAAAERAGLTEEARDLVRGGGKAAAGWLAAGPSAPPQRQLLISFAAATGNVEVVTALLDAGADPDRAPEGTPPPLAAAAGEAQAEVVRLLLGRGASPNGADGKTWLPLAGAAQSGDLETVSVLLAAGANRKAKPAGGHKLVDHARGPFSREIRDAIMAKGA
jgi:ankyrin repeat protein